MKYILTEDQFKALSEETQKEYTLTDGTATLTLEGHEEAFVPKGKWAESEKHRKNAETKTLDVEKRETKLLADLEANKGDKNKMQELRDSHTAEVAKIKEESDARILAFKGETHKALIEAEASSFSEKNFTVPGIMKDVIAKRMMVEEVDGQAVIRALDADGKVSIKSVSEMQKEILENKDYSSIIKASQGSGGGAHTNPDGKGGGASKQVTRSEFDSMSQAERSTFSVDGGAVVDD
tara:strand:- start:4435 stop:5145 length:711 start_codon:yes stop_codon:yes gene_type:complete